MNLDELEASMIHSAQRDLGPSSSDRERHHAELMARLQGAAPSRTGGSRFARNENDPAGRLGLGSALWRAPKSSGWSRFELLGVGLVLGVVLGGVLGFGLGRGWFGVSDRAAVDVAAVDGANVDVAAAAGDGAHDLVPRAVVAEASGESVGGAVAAGVPALAATKSDGASEGAAEHNEPSAETQAGGAVVASPAGGAARRARRVAAAPKVESSLAMELSMLQRARRALNADNGRLALGIVQELDERFPKGVLIEERNATRVLSLCMLNRAEEAQRFARLFLERHPASVYAERVRQSCIADPVE